MVTTQQREIVSAEKRRVGGQSIFTYPLDISTVTAHPKKTLQIPFAPLSIEAQTRAAESQHPLLQMLMQTGMLDQILPLPVRPSEPILEELSLPGLARDVCKHNTDSAHAHTTPKRAHTHTHTHTEEGNSSQTHPQRPRTADCRHVWCRNLRSRRSATTRFLSPFYLMTFSSYALGCIGYNTSIVSLHLKRRQAFRISVVLARVSTTTFRSTFHLTEKRRSGLPLVTNNNTH